MQVIHNEITKCDMVISYYIIIMITVHVMVDRVYLVEYITNMLLIVSLNIFYNGGGAYSIIVEECREFSIFVCACDHFPHILLTS